MGLQKGNKIVRSIISVVSVISIFVAVGYVQLSYDVFSYLTTKYQETDLYQDVYVEPFDVLIETPEKQRNLLYIYMESMETTYADVENGGKQEDNYMPYCTQLASENISFSEFYPVNGATWTMGALFTSSSALPFAFPVDANSMQRETQFASGVYTLGDFLKDQGYTQEFLCGSDAIFAGRRTFFEQHGNYEIFDLYTAREKKYIPQDYYTWWGYEDKILYEIAKEELLRLSAEDKPFNLTMLTADAHHIGGFVCDICENKYSDATANVICCADRQLEEFLNWCEQQEFYENTTIVIVGDHPRMDTCLVGEEDLFDRTLFNCFINTVCEEPYQVENREASMLDMFPTVLAAMGYKIQGGRLGLGINLFSIEQTLLEQYGRENINSEFIKNSSYYVKRFAPEMSNRVANTEEALFTIYFVEENYNASEYVKEGISECMGKFTWFNADQMIVSMPIRKKEERVYVSIFVMGTARAIPYQIKQDGEVIYEDIMIDNGVIGFEAEVIDGVCEFELCIPFDELEDGYEIEDPRTLKLTYITVEPMED